MDVQFYKDSRFVSDLPASTDEFPSGAHHRVAQTLVDIIVTGEGGRAIGLEGTWGSGKSTVIDFALAQFGLWNKAATDPHYAMFVFDAWAHQGDPIRRAFLDELITYLSDSQNSIIEKNYWSGELEKLRSKHKQTVETKAEKLSWVAWIALAALPLFPLAYLVISQGMKGDSSTFSYEIPFVATVTFFDLVLAAYFLIALPYIAAATTWLAWRRSFWPFSKGWYHPKPGKEGKSVLVAFSRQTDHVTTDQLIKEDEATTTEFNAVFDRVIAAAKSNNHQIVIVLDNLDRLSNEQIRDVWAIMRNFFATTPTSPRRAILKNIWLVVPIDRQHIEAVFADGHGHPQDQTTRGFIEKTFEIVLRVPPPLLSNWQTFLKSKLTEAFNGKLSEHEAYKIFRFFELYTAAHPSNITPRTIKAYVNKIVSQAKIAGNSIPIEYQALFVLYKDQIAAQVTKLQDSTILDEPVKAAVDNDEWAKFLAAAHFSVAPDDALELLLTPEVEKALIEHRSDRLAELQKTKGFDLLVHGLLASKAGLWANENASAFFEIVATLDEIKLLDSAAQDETWREVANALLRVGKPLAPGRHTASACRAIILRNPFARSEECARRLVRIFSIPLVEFSDQSGTEWIAVIEETARALDSVNKKVDFDSVFSAIHIPSNVLHLIGAADTISRSHYLTLSNFSPDSSVEDVSDALTALIQAANPPNPLEGAILAFQGVPKLVNWKRVVPALQTRLQTNSPTLTTASALRLLNVSADLRLSTTTRERISPMLKALSSDGSLHGILELGRREKNTELVARSLMELILQRGHDLVGPTEHPQYGQLQSANDFVKGILSSPENEEKTVEALTQIATTERTSSTFQRQSLAAENSKLFREIFKRLVESNTLGTLYSAEILTEFSLVAEVVGEQLKFSLLKEFDNFKIDDALAEGKWADVAPSFLVASQSAKTKHYTRCRDVIVAALEKLPSEQWAKVLDEQNNVLALLFTLINLGEIQTLDAGYFDSLRAHAHRLIDGQAAFPTKYTDDWPKLPGLLAAWHRPQFYRSVRDHLVNRAPGIAIVQGVFRLYGKDFGQNADLPDRNDVIRTIIEPLVADGSDQSLDILDSNSDVFRETIARANESDKHFVTDRFRTVIASTVGDHAPRLKAIAAALAVDAEDNAQGTDTGDPPTRQS